jgi:FkbM family methyltransferase
MIREYFLSTHLSHDLSNKFIDLQKILKPSVYIEVGAFDAEFSKAIVSKDPNAKVWAFEASPYVHQKYFPIDKVNYINKAVSDKNGYIDFELQKDIDLATVNNSIMKRNEDKEYEYVQVESITLDSLFFEYNNICLWIDCEGANREVLLGASKILPNVSSIFIEVEEVNFWKDQWLDKDVIEYLTGFGFKLIDRDTQYPKQYNCIFIKNQS